MPAGGIDVSGGLDLQTEGIKNADDTCPNCFSVGKAWRITTACMSIHKIKIKLLHDLIVFCLVFFILIGEGTAALTNILE